MAAQDYYQSFAPTQQAPQHQQQPWRRPSLYDQPQRTSSYSSQSFNPQEGPYNNQIAPYVPQLQQQQQQQYSSSPSQYSNAPYPHVGSPMPQAAQPDAQNYMPQRQNTYGNQLGPPLQPQRSYSSPPDPRHVHFDTERGRRASSSHRRSLSRSSSYDSEDSYSRSRSRSRSRTRGHGRRRSRRMSDNKREHKSRDTFLGAGGGALIGDAIFPGAGTLGGLLLGGLGGREYNRRRSRSELPPKEREHSHHHSAKRHDGSYRDGITVKSGIIRR